MATYVWATQWPTSSELKIKFGPSFDTSWCEFFKVIKDHGPKNSHPGYNLGALLPSPSGHLFKKNWLSVLSIYIVVLVLVVLVLWYSLLKTLTFYSSFAQHTVVQTLEILDKLKSYWVKLFPSVLFRYSKQSIQT